MSTPLYYTINHFFKKEIQVLMLSFPPHFTFYVPKSSTWFYLFIYFLIFIFTLFCFTILYWFCHKLTWISHGCTWVPNPEPPSPLPPHIISLDHPHAPAPSIRYSVSNIDWHFISLIQVLNQNFIPYVLLHHLHCSGIISFNSQQFCTYWQKAPKYVFV